MSKNIATDNEGNYANDKNVPGVKGNWTPILDKTACIM